jgi:hypothetical protein
VGDFKVGAKIDFDLAFSLAQESGTVEGELKFKNLSTPEGKVKVQTKIAEGVKLTGTGKVSPEKGSLSVGVEFAGTSPGDKINWDFSPVQADAKKGKLKVGVLERKQTVQVGEKQFEIDGIKINVTGSYAVTISAAPDWVKIGAKVAERYGVDVAASAAAGGTGAAGALAVAAAPAAGIAGGIVGGIALAVGAMKLIDVLEAQGRDATDICVEGARRLRAYAESYGSTMRGSPGSNEEGNKDAEARLQAMMKASPGMTHDQAVETAKQSKQNFEDMAYRAVLPTMRDKVKEAYDKAHPLTGDSLFNKIRNEVLAEDSHY